MQLSLAVWKLCISAISDEFVLRLLTSLRHNFGLSATISQSGADCQTICHVRIPADAHVNLPLQVMYSGLVHYPATVADPYQRLG